MSNLALYIHFNIIQLSFVVLASREDIAVRTFIVLNRMDGLSFKVDLRKVEKKVICSSSRQKYLLYEGHVGQRAL